MRIKKIDYDFSVCKVADYSLVDLTADYCFVGKTEEENSLVCITDNVPLNVIRREDFSLIGILSGISGILADNQISIFVLSTFDTDYVLTKTENYQSALDILEAAGYEIVQ